MTERREITLEMGDAEFTFHLDGALVTKYFNGLTATNKVAPSHNLLVTAVDQKQLATLRPLLANPDDHHEAGRRAPGGVRPGR